MKNYSYIQFPLFLIQDFYDYDKKPKKILDKILNFGLVHFAEKNIECDENQIDIYIQEAMTLTESLFDEEIDSDFAILIYKLSKIVDGFNITVNNYINVVSDYYDVLSSVNFFTRFNGKDAWTSIKTDMLYDFSNSLKDLHLLQAYLGINSIIGSKKFIKTYKSVIISRMFGCKNDKVLKDLLRKKSIKKQYEIYSKRYQVDKLLNELELRGFITKIGYKRGIYISKQVQDKKALAQLINEKDELKQLKKQENEARKLLNQKN